MEKFFQKIRLWRVALAYEISQWRFETLRDGLADIFQAEQERWFLFLPVFLGAGIALYFALPSEPLLSLALLLVMAASLFLIALGYFCGFDHLSMPLAAALLMLSLGFALAKFRSLSVSAPVITKTLNGNILEGRIASVSASPDKKAARWIIEPTHISGLALSAMPRKIRVKIKPFAARPEFQAGDRVRMSALIFPPPGPAMPGGFDFSRAFWFERTGGTAIALDQPQRLARLTAQDNLWPRMIAMLDHGRNYIAERIIKSTKDEGSNGARGIAAALIVGKRDFIPQKISNRLRDTGLAHILAISGLHMAALAGAVYFMIRACLALFPFLTLRYPIKKWAIVPALICALIYLILAGGSVATQRAFIMFSIAGLAILAGAQVITMRNVAFAALIILALAPESLLHAGFQLSFAATISIVAVYEIVSLRGLSYQIPYRRRPQRRRPQRRSRRNQLAGLTFDDVRAFLFRSGVRATLTLALTSLAAWTATAPLAVIHFNRIAILPALVANLSVLPILTIWIMPAIVVALILMIFGLDSFMLIFLIWGIEFILVIVDWIVQSLGSARIVASPPDWVFIFYIIGGLWLCFLRTSWRWIGIVPLIFAAGQGLFIKADRFDLLIAREGNMIAMRDVDGRLYPSSRAGHWTLTQWLRADGDQRTAWRAYDRRKFSCTKAGCISMMDHRPKVLLLRNPDDEQADFLCQSADIVIFAKKASESLCASARLRISHDDILRGGAHGVFFRKENGLFEIHRASSTRGQRDWTGPRFNIP